MGKYIYEVYPTKKSMELNPDIVTLEQYKGDIWNKVQDHIEQLVLDGFLVKVWKT